MGGSLNVRTVCLLAGVLLAATTNLANADIGFTRKGPFEACLDGAYGTWVKIQAEHLVNEDRRAQHLDDASVAAWTVATLNDCRKRAAAEAGSVERFGRYMARWREHVFDLAASIRRSGQSD